jgi:DNA-directed RNA polymerase subunit RPC12/RpoP
MARRKCVTCGQWYDDSVLNSHGEGNNCATTLELTFPLENNQKTKDNYCTQCGTRLSHYVLFNIRKFGCSKCGTDDRTR